MVIKSVTMKKVRKDKKLWKMACNVGNNWYVPKFIALHYLRVLNECEYHIIVLFNFYDYSVYNFVSIQFKKCSSYVIVYNIISKTKNRVKLLLLQKNTQKAEKVCRNLTFLFSYAQLSNHQYYEILPFI